jgi:heme-degrading monooxygenase HmoA
MPGFATANDASQALEASSQELAAIPGVVGTAVGRSKKDEDYVVHIFVRSEEDVDSTERAATRTLGESRSEVIVSGELTAFDG